MIRQLFLLFAFLSLSSCYTIHFSKEADLPPDHYETSQWHHIGLLGLMEFSSPVNLEQVCPKNSWGHVRVQTGLLQGLVRLISVPTGGYVLEASEGISVPQTISVGSFYSPEEVSVSCSVKNQKVLDKKLFKEGSSP